MMSKVAIFAAGIAVGGGLVGWYLFGLHRHWDEREAFIEPAAEAVNSIMILDQLRTGDTNSAVETLERNLDGALVGLSLYNSNEFQAAEHDLIQGALRQAREYRSKHPRPPREDGHPEVDAAIARALANED